jgi:hypothetical protein
VDCTGTLGGSGRCEAGACVDQPDGAPCDGGRFRCETGLLCIGADTGVGVCEPVPVEWTCNPAYYGSGDGCDCGCGVVDPDCNNRNSIGCDFCDSAGSCNALPGCPGNVLPFENSTCSVCGDGFVEGSERCDLQPANPALCDDLCRWIIPAAWTCFAGYFGTDDGCDCGCGAVDPDCGDGGVAACVYCANPGSCGEGEPDDTACGLINPDDTATCGVWTCDAGWIGDGTCDCGCGSPDPDCTDLTATSCERCDSTLGCDAAGDCATIDPLLNTLCSTCGDSNVEGSEECDPPDGTTCDASCYVIDDVVNVPPEWSCDAAWYDAQDGCDCGCGAPDPDCADSAPATCAYCLTCDPDFDLCVAALDPTDNSQCL